MCARIDRQRREPIVAGRHRQQVIFFWNSAGESEYRYLQCDPELKEKRHTGGVVDIEHPRAAHVARIARDLAQDARADTLATKRRLDEEFAQKPLGFKRMRKSDSYGRTLIVRDPCPARRICGEADI